MAVCPAGGKHSWRLITVEATQDRKANILHYDIFWYCTKCRNEEDYEGPKPRP